MNLKDMKIGQVITASKPTKDERVKELMKMSKGNLLIIHKKYYKVSNANNSPKDAIISDILEAEGYFKK